MRRPRFSLLSMVLFTLLCGSAVALWMHWPAWRPVATVGGSHVDYRIDSSRSLILVRDQTGDFHDLFDSNGNRIQHFAADPASESGMFSEQGACIEFSPIDKSRPTRLWRIASQRWEEAPRKKEAPIFSDGNGEELSLNGNWLLAKPSNSGVELWSFTLFEAAGRKAVAQRTFKQTEGIPAVFFYELGGGRDAICYQFLEYCELREIPSLKLLLTFPSSADTRCSSDGRWLACEIWTESLIKIYDLNTGDLRHSLAHRPGTGPFDRSVAIRFSPDNDELYAVDNGSHFAVRWSLPNWHETEFEVAKSSDGFRVLMGVTFSKDGLRIDAWDKHYNLGWLTSWNRKTGALIYDGTTAAMTHDAAPLRLIDAEGNLLAPPATQPIARFNDEDRFEFFADRDRILVHSESDGLKIYGRHRPEAWWGIAWLPEFWSTIVFAGLFGWNLWRGRFSR